MRPLTNPRSPARGLVLPQAIPDAVQRALAHAPAPGGGGKRQSMQRATRWWLPYIILEFDRNQVMIDAVDGDISNPVYNYRASLCVVPATAAAAVPLTPAQRRVLAREGRRDSLPPRTGAASREGGPGRE
jgi:hypothetical protein